MNVALEWMKQHNEIASWVQAFGAILALGISIALAAWQSHQTRQQTIARDRESAVQMFESFGAACDHAEISFRRWLDALYDQSVFELLGSPSELSKLRRLTNLIESYPTHQLPTYESVRISLDIKDNCHCMEEVLSLMAKEMTGAVPSGDVRLSDLWDVLESRLEEVQDLITQFAKERNTYRNT
ncbi:hypothetical protein AADU03_004803 [Escherichia coli]